MDSSASLAKVYVVTSFAFGSENDVKIHYLGPDLSKARDAYDEVSSRPEAMDDPTAGCQLLVDLTEVDSGFSEEHTLFWGGDQVNCRTVRRNNGGGSGDASGSAEESDEEV